MSNAPALCYEDSKGILLFRLKTRAGVPVTAGATVTATVTLAGVSVISPSSRSLTYDSAAILWSGDDETGAWTCDLAASELATAGTYIATITVVVAAVTVHTAVLRIPVVPDTGRRST